MFERCRSFCRRAGTYLGRRRVEARLRDELEFHAEMAAAAEMRSGASPEEARRRAHLAVGGFDRAREEYRDALGFRLFDDLGHDMRVALRGLRRSPALTVVAVVTLALGIGANTLLFNAVYALLWRDLPFAAPDRLVALAAETPEGSGPSQASGYDAAWIRDHVTSVEEVGLAARQAPMTIVVGDSTSDLESAWVNTGYLRALGVRPVAGRLFGEDDDRGLGGKPAGGRHFEGQDGGTAAETAALLVETAWHRYFGGDPSVVGRTITMVEGTTRRPIRILGVLPDRVTLPYISGAEIVVAIPWQHPSLRADRGTAQFRTVLRLRPDVTLAQASAEVTSAIAAANADLPRNQRAGRAWLVPLREAILLGSRTPIWLLYAAAGLLLVLTTANVAGLFLARTLARRHESAVRTALGASWRHLVRAQFAEALLVCLAGLAAALALTHLIRPVLPAVFPELEEVGPELLQTGHVLITFGVACALVVAMALSLLPALFGRRIAPAETLAASARVAGVRTRGRDVLAAVQLGLILVLLAVGSLVARSFAQALRSDPGFDPRGVVTFRASLPAQPEARTGMASEIVGILASMPGTTRATFSFESPLGGGFAAKHTARAEADPADPMIPIRLVGSGYLETLGARLVRGRTPNEDEVRAGRSVAVLNETAARLLFGGEDPVGRTVRSGFMGSQLTVIGLVRDMRTSGLDRQADPALYRPYLPYFASGVVFSVRTSEPLDRVVPAVSRRLGAWNPAVVVHAGRSLDASTRRSVRPRLRAAYLVGTFALLGMLIGTVGLYGTLSADVSRRSRELGVRLALGAPTGAVLARVLSQGMRLVLAGVVLGLGGSVAVAILIRRHLFGITPWDAPSFLVAIAVLGAGASVAVLLPAVRASRIDPAATLREG